MSAPTTCCRPARSRSSGCRCSGGPATSLRADLQRRRGRERVIAPWTAAPVCVIHGWKTELPLTAVDAVRALEPFCGEFLYTHVDTEGLMGGTNLEAIRAVQSATSRRLTAAGGITTQREIDDLDALGIDAVVGMAIYTGALNPEPRTPEP
jgi:phosphoribosylformimino-5-aminoimidazole carboxamide ribotide isomerase